MSASMGPGSVIRVLDECQRGTGVHSRAVSMVRNMLREDEAGVEAELWGCLRHCLLVFKREATVERLMRFLVTLVVECMSGGQEEETAFAERMLMRFLEHSGAADKAVRFRVCQFTAGVIAQMGEEAEVSDELWDVVMERMMVRLKDKVPVVRAHAAAALGRLQDPGDDEQDLFADDPVVEEYIRMLKEDRSKDVRKAVLANIAVCDRTITLVLQRCRDVSDEVRRCAFLVLAAKVEPSMLSISQRAFIALNGLRDRSLSVRNACEKELVCKAWLGACDGDAMELLRMLDIESSSDSELAGQLCIRSLLAKDLIRAPGDDVLGGDEPLTAEAALVLRTRIEDLARSRSPAIEDALPEPALLSKLLLAHKEDEFIFRQLLHVARRMEFWDEGGRKMLGSMLFDILVRSETVKEAAVDDLERADNVLVSLLHVMHLVHKDERECTRVLMEALECLRGDLADPSSIDDEDSPEARSWIFCINVVRAMFLTTTSAAGMLSPLGPEVAEGDASPPATSAQVLLDTFVFPAVSHTMGSVRRIGVNALGCACLLDRFMALEHYSVLVQALNTPSECLGVRRGAFSALCDLAVFFGPETFDSKAVATLSTDGTDAGPFMATLFGYLGGGGGREDEVSVALKSVAVEGLAKLLITRFNNSQGWEVARTDNGGAEVGWEQFDASLAFARLVHIFFTTVGEAGSGSHPEADRIRQCLAVFFPAFATMSSSRQMAIDQAFVPCLLELLEDVRNEKSAKVVTSSWTQVSRFTLDLLSMPIRQAADVHVDSEYADGQEEIAIRVLSEIVRLIPQVENHARGHVYARTQLLCLARSLGLLKMRESSGEASAVALALIAQVKDHENFTYITQDRVASKGVHNFESLAQRAAEAGVDSNDQEMEAARGAHSSPNKQQSARPPRQEVLGELNE